MSVPKFEVNELSIFIISIAIVFIVLSTGAAISECTSIGYAHKETMLALEKGYKEVKGTKSNFVKMGVHLRFDNTATATKEVLNAEDNR